MEMERSTTFKWLSVCTVSAALLTGVALGDSTQLQQPYGFGRTPTQAEINAWNIDVRGSDGNGLPPGSGTVAQGEAIYAAQCASCHGDFGEGNGRMPLLAGGRGTLTSAQPMQTVGSYWPYAPTLFDYIRRAMPFPNPESLSNDEVYAVTAYVLYLNDIVKQNSVLDAKTLAAITMPNRNGFVKDPRPDIHNVACMYDCKSAPVQITSDLAKTLHVTPSQAQNSPAPAPTSVSFAAVQAIIAQRCAVCHAEKPTQPGVSQAPMGVLLDTPQQIKAEAAAIKSQTVTSQAMPVGNVTNMTDQERALVGAWIDAGAKLP
jgi:S-disulfanyl-L-cysteine oxidoreductase SoxD